MKKNNLALFLTALLSACAGTKENTTPMTFSPSSPGSPIKMELRDPPLVGTTPAGDRIYLGGFSGLRYLGRNANGTLRFLTHTDRGPNTEETKGEDGKQRPFLLPGYQPRILLIEADPKAGTLRVEKQILLKRPNGQKLSGIPQPPGHEHPVDSLGKSLPFDPYGMDLEGIALAADGSYWMVEEYGPSVSRFSPEGKLLETLKPGSGLPKIFAWRRPNRGFEGCALLGDRLYVALQSPLDNPPSKKWKNSKNSKILRIAEVDTAGKRTLGQYAYVLGDGDRIGDLAVEGARTLLVIEQDKKLFKRVYRIDLSEATNLQLLPDAIAGPGGSLESTEDLAAAGIKAVEKTEVLDLAAAGVKEAKVEGIDLVEGHIAVTTDNDFSLNGDLDLSTGKVEFKKENPAIYLFPPESWNK